MGGVKVASLKIDSAHKKNMSSSDDDFIDDSDKIEDFDSDDDPEYGAEESDFCELITKKYLTQIRKHIGKAVGGNLEHQLKKLLRNCKEGYSVSLKEVKDKFLKAGLFRIGEIEETENVGACGCCGHNPVKNFQLVEMASTKDRYHVGSECRKLFPSQREKALQQVKQ